MLQGELPWKQVWDKIAELDQSTPNRAFAIANLAFLTDLEISQYIQTQSVESQKSHYQLLGFTAFHVGQITACNGKNDEALSLFKLSLEYEYKANAFKENIAYKKATIAYFEMNAVALKEAITEDITGNNRLVVENLLKGLLKRGTPDYNRDYNMGGPTRTGP